LTATEASPVRQLADAYWEQLLELEPLLATQIGDERFDDRLPDPSEDALAAAADVHRAALGHVREAHEAAGDVEERTALRLIEAIASVELEAIETQFGRFEAFSHLFGPGMLVGTIASIQATDTPERLDRYLRRLAAVPEYLDSIVAVVHDAVASGQTPSRLVVDRSIQQVERLLAAGPRGGPAHTGVAEDDTEARARVSATVEEAVLPAYRRYLDALVTAREQAPEAIGVGALPGGERLYRSRILAWTSAPLDPGEIHEIGHEELARIDEERAEIAERLGHRNADDALAAYNSGGENVLRAREDAVALARDMVERGWEACHGCFGAMPAANCEVRPIDESREADVLDYYMPPTADGMRAGVFYISTVPGRLLHQLATTVYHETSPGHHLQISLGQEVGERPAIRRFGYELVANALVEGWAVYAERLADELGLFTSEYERLGMLEMQALRATRLIVDTGIHARGWTRERALEEMARSGMPQAEIEIEVDRYAGYPAQALCYTIGRRAVDRLRATAQSREGASFSLPGFHDRLLGLGALPLDMLEAEMSAA
jgi:uncharacterized protein (DUF885 family)